MRKIIRDIIIVTVLLGLIGFDQSYVPKNPDEVKEQAVGELNGEVLPSVEFYTDGCSLWPQAIFGISWEEACIDHDIKYWAGGSDEEKLKADQKLRDDVNKFFPGMGDIMYLGVRAGGRKLLPIIPWYWGWGYGWDGNGNGTTTPDSFLKEKYENIKI